MSTPVAVPQTIGQRLAAPFDQTFTDNRGGVTLTYITGEQVVSRLNAVLGFDGWTFRVREHGTNVEADEVWVLGRLEFTSPAGATDRPLVREQFGSQKVRRARSNGTPVDIGFDLKGAGTDALKKCASLIGVGLYLSQKDAPAPAQSEPTERVGQSHVDGQHAETVPVCAECNAELKETRFRDGTVWGPQQLAGYGTRKHGKVLCMDCYRRANEAARRQSAPAGQPA